MINKIKAKWNEIITFLRDDFELTDVSFNTWIIPLKPDSLTTDSRGNSTLHIFVPNESFRLYVSKKFAFNLAVCIEEITLIKCDVLFEAEGTDPVRGKSRNQLIQNRKFEVDNLKLLNANLNPGYTFETFVVGKSNDFAHAASVAVAETPGETYNPLFIYGGVGLGKTHLMHSIAHYILQHNPNYKILYITSEKFLNEYVDAIKNSSRDNSITEFRNKYRNVDVLLMDDIQFITGKDATQEELFHTFNALYEVKRQIILSSDKPPMELKNLEERLRSRFEWGLSVEIQTPDYETRMAILRSKEERDGKNIDNEVLQYIATNIKSNIRMLEGALNKIYAMSRLNRNQEIDLDLAKDVLKDMITPDAPSKITSEYIATVVAEHFNITLEDLKAKGRKEPVATARHITVYLCRKMTNDTQTKIAKFLGNRDHSTIVNSEDVISKKINVDPALHQTVDTIQKKISPQ